MSTLKRNFYEILNATSAASFDELKSNYKQLILQCHPDKMQQHFEIEKINLQMNNDPNNLEFVAITEAWNCLRDPVKRKQYDAELLLNKFHTHNNIYAHIKLSEMKKQPNTGGHHESEGAEYDTSIRESVKDEEPKYHYTYDCRCGGQYIVDESAEQYYRSNNNHDTKINNSDNNGIGGDDDTDNKSVSGSTAQKNKNSLNISECRSNAGSSSAGGGEGVVQDNGDCDDDVYVDVDEEVGGELIVECSECSLVIILNG